MEKCENCYYNREFGVLLRCHRHPPNSLVTSIWPVVSRNDWCGEWRAKDTVVTETGRTIPVSKRDRLKREYVKIKGWASE